MYGNIGIPDRLQFTIVGAAANEAAHLATLCKTLGQSILISSAFQRCFANETTSLGFHYLRGVERAQEIFTLSDLRSETPLQARATSASLEGETQCGSSLASFQRRSE